MNGALRPERDFLRSLLERTAVTATVVAAVLALLTLLMRMVTHFPFFDEALNIHYLWLLASGQRPEADFFCVYPALGYILTAPYLRLFPESGFVILALRGLSVALAVFMGCIFYQHGRRASESGMTGLFPYLLVIAAPGIGAYAVEYSIDHLATLSALGAIYLFFRPLQVRSFAAASVLCLLSVMIMPKYVFPLFFGMLGALIGNAVQQRNLRAVLAAAAGGLGALVLIVLAYSLSGVSLLDSLRYSHVLQYRYQSANGFFGKESWRLPIIYSVGEFLVHNPVYGAAVALGIAGWVMHTRQAGVAAALGGWGVLSGAFLSSVLVQGFLEQYITPVLFCLAFFVPYAFTAKLPSRLTETARTLFALGTAATLVVLFAVTAPDFKETTYNCRQDTEACRQAVRNVDMVQPGTFILSAYSDVLALVPPGEQVVAVWPIHPLFRKDPAFITVDDRPSFLASLPSDDPLRERFDPEVFRQALETRPPAGIALFNLEKNYPPGWDAVAARFLERNAGRYVPYMNDWYEIYIRRDLFFPAEAEGKGRENKH